MTFLNWWEHFLPIAMFNVSFQVMIFENFFDIGIQETKILFSQLVIKLTN